MYNFWKTELVLFLPTCMKETGQSRFTFGNAGLFWRKNLVQWMKLKSGDFFDNTILWGVKTSGKWLGRKMEMVKGSMKRSKWWTVHCWVDKEFS